MRDLSKPSVVRGWQVRVQPYDLSRPRRVLRIRERWVRWNAGVRHLLGRGRDLSERAVQLHPEDLCGPGRELWKRPRWLRQHLELRDLLGRDPLVRRRRHEQVWRRPLHANNVRGAEQELRHDFRRLRQ